MTKPRTAYELSRSQVSTPVGVVSLFWRITKQHRPHFESVLDLGADDCRLAEGGSYDAYTGVEIDAKKASVAKPPSNGVLFRGCVFRHKESGYSGCIANPPFVRHHDVRSPWKERTAKRLERELGIKLNKHCNLYLYFFCLALLKTSEDGLISFIMPYEWVSRPAFKSVRDYLRSQRWGVSVYRFQTPVFDRVMTTASVSVVDKSNKSGKWTYFDITADHVVKPRAGVTGSRKSVLDYSNRGQTWALRGLSPGSQKIFTLTEKERKSAGLTKRDVVPCVTTLRYLPRKPKVLTRAQFKKYYVDAGKRCWLICSFRKERSTKLNAYLASVPRSARQTYTCLNQSPWFNYRPHPTPQLLFSSGFTKFGPKVLINHVGARAIGSVWGIHSKRRLKHRSLQTFLLRTNFEQQIVAHANSLKKVEVRQLNAVLNEFDNQQNNGRKSTC
jgi:hypothetical protein